MLKHIMEIVKGNTEFIKADQTPRTWRVSLNVRDHFSVHYWLNRSMRMIDNDEVGLKKARRFLIAFFGTAHLGMRRVVTPRGSMVGDARHWRDQPFYAIPKQLQWSLCEDKFVIQAESFTYERQVSVNNSKSYGSTESALSDHHIKITRYVHRLSQLSLFLN